MSLPCSDQSIRPRKMKNASLPPGVAVLRCWCGDLCKVKEVTDFSDWLGMKFFMCANYEEDPAVALSEYDKPPSPPPLCMYYRWIDTEKPAWAVTEIRERSRRAWNSLFAEERREKAEAEEKAEQERELKEYYAEQHRVFQEMGKKTGKRLVAWRSRNNSERRLVRLRGRERKKGLVRPRQQKKLAMEKENIHAGLSRFLW
ncbi:hypothetical protein VPH35_066876 [Triticum aestivum]